MRRTLIGRDRESLRSLHLRTILFRRRDHVIAMGDTALRRHLFWMKRLDTAAPEGNVNYLLHWCENFLIKRVHIHTLCENFISGKYVRRAERPRSLS